mmetsp:Transcript_52864/g.104930  ORF Transcript_52864/g.104930 Transcript_52864/m.104930 type:complete len:112 (+) Transcript_52864:333-668(+)
MKTGFWSLEQSEELFSKKLPWHLHRRQKQISWLVFPRKKKTWRKKLRNRECSQGMRSRSRRLLLTPPPPPLSDKNPNSGELKQGLQGCLIDKNPTEDNMDFCAFIVPHSGF